MTLPVELAAWATRHGVSGFALRELAATLGALATPNPGEGKSESFVQSQIRLDAPRRDMRLFRNNVGALTDARGVPVRFGLANDTKAMNERIKSGDLLGWRRVRITPEMAGSVIAQFVSIECKKQGWKYVGDDHEKAQMRWAGLVCTEGGYARFADGLKGLE